MINITLNNKDYSIDKEKLLFVLSRIKEDEVKDEEIMELMEKYCLMDESFLKNVNKLQGGNQVL